MNNNSNNLFFDKNLLIENDHTSRNQNVDEALGYLIKKHRKKQGLTGVELGKMLNISQQQISRYERGVNNFSIDRIIDILLILNISQEDLVKVIIDEIMHRSVFN
ncbi:MAG: helix-turn-helix transcriptional regulator [Providencia sp.]|jgi:predicted transcriptional regulator|nr:helix-turn-helix transcriptional regulator [Providencia sp.]